MDNKYSITAYLITTKERLKYFGDESRDTCVKKQEYLDDPSKFTFDFVNSIKNHAVNEIDRYMSVTNEIPINLPAIAGKELVVNFGKNGQEFLTVKSDGVKNEYDRKTKIVKFYRNFFLKRADGKVFMVIFRDGVNSCKTALYQEMKKFTHNTNVIVDLTYVSNEEYISSLYENVKYINLNYDIVYKEIPSDNADEPFKKKRKYSSCAIDLSLRQTKTKFRSFLDNLFRGSGGRQNRITLATTLSADLSDTNRYDVDSDSLSVLVELNGVRRTINIEDVARFYDVDITSKLDYDDENNPTIESIRREVIDFVSGINVEEQGE